MNAGSSTADRILTIPNVVSFVRLAGVPVFWWVLLAQDNIGLAAVFIFAIGWTDWIDGYLARRLGQESRLGRILDPVADRLMIASAVVGGLVADVVPDIIGWPLITREVLMGLVTLILILRGWSVLEVRYLGKLATFILYGAIPSFYLAEAGFLAQVFRPLGLVTGLIGLAIYWLVTFQYLVDARSRILQLESPANQEES